jgi:hypothetical protein
MSKGFAFNFVGRVLLTANIIFQLCIFLIILVQGQFIIAVEANKTILVSEIIASAFLVVYGIYLSAQYLLEHAKRL